jgi:hypothetical protein
VPGSPTLSARLLAGPPNEGFRDALAANTGEAFVVGEIETGSGTVTITELMGKY